MQSQAPVEGNKRGKVGKPDYNYRRQEEREFEFQIGLMLLTDLQKTYLRGPWLTRLVYYRRKSQVRAMVLESLRFIRVVCGVLIPVLVTIDRDKLSNPYLRWSIIGAGLLVGLTTAIDGAFRLGDRWVTTYQLSEKLRTVGREYIYSLHPYQEGHDKSFALFAEHVEDIVNAYPDASSPIMLYEKNPEDGRRKRKSGGQQ